GLVAIFDSEPRGAHAADWKRRRVGLARPAGRLRQGGGGIPPAHEEYRAGPARNLNEPDLSGENSSGGRGLHFVGHEEWPIVTNCRYCHISKAYMAGREVVVQARGRELDSLTAGSTDRKLEGIGPYWRCVHDQHTDCGQQQECKRDDESPPTHRSCPMLRRQSSCHGDEAQSPADVLP